MFITEDDYKVVIGDTAMKVVSQASAENRANACLLYTSALPLSVQAICSSSFFLFYGYTF